MQKTENDLFSTCFSIKKHFCVCHVLGGTRLWRCYIVLYELVIAAWKFKSIKELHKKRRKCEFLCVFPT